MKILSILISGAGSGMGLHTAEMLIRAGHQVYAGIADPKGRNLDKAEGLKDFATGYGRRVKIVDLDIRSEMSCRLAVSQVVVESGRLDVVIHNSANLFVGVSEGFTPEQLLDAVNTNAVGAHRLNRAVLPFMRKQEHGLLLYIGSGISRIVAPFMAPYVVSKYALDALAEATAYEVGSFGIESTIVMPGVFIEGGAPFESTVFPNDTHVLDGYGRMKRDMDNYVPGLRNLLHHDVVSREESVADEILRIINLPAGLRPMRITVNDTEYGAEIVNDVAEVQTEKVFNIMGFSHLLKAKIKLDADVKDRDLV